MYKIHFNKNRYLYVHYIFVHTNCENYKNVNLYVHFILVRTF